jgi:hypothetical protein
MIEVYMWEYPVGDEIERCFQKVDKSDPDQNPFLDDETSNPTDIVMMSESLYQAYVNAAMTKSALEESMLAEGKRWKSLTDRTYSEMSAAAEEANE